MDEKIAVQDAGSDLKQIAATLLETEQAVESRVSAKVEAAASDVRSQAQSLASDVKVLCNLLGYRHTCRFLYRVGAFLSTCGWLTVSCAWALRRRQSSATRAAGSEFCWRGQDASLHSFSCVSWSVGMKHAASPRSCLRAVVSKADISPCTANLHCCAAGIFL